MGARAPPGRRKFVGVILWGKLYQHPQAEQEVKFLMKFLLSREKLEGGSG